MSTALVPAPAQVIEHFARHQRLTVKQRKRWLEILLSFEAKNKYVVYDEDQQPVLAVEEQGKGFLSFLKRVFLGPFRPFTAHVEDLSRNALLLSLHRPWRWIFHTIEVAGPSGEAIGRIEKRWSWLRRIYTVYGAGGEEVATLFGPIFKPWTFEIRVGGNPEPVGLLQKKWSGLAKEMFTDADNFRLELSGIPDPSVKALLFSATVLVDVVHFERAKR